MPQFPPSSNAIVDSGFDAAWLATFRRQRDMLEAAAAVIRLTEGGAHPVGIARLAADLALRADEVRSLVDRANTGLPSLTTWHTDDEVWLDLTTENPRFWYRIGDRRIGVAGCAPDIFWVAQSLGQPMSVEASCPATGAPIHVRFSPEGMRDATPADTVVAVIDPNTVPEATRLTDAARVDADVCVQQTFFADADAAQTWLDRHPGGRVLPAAAFDQWFTDVRSRADAAEPATTTAP